MEEEKKDWVKKFSKDELIEDIQREFATDAKNNIGCAGVFLLLIVFNVISAFKTSDWLSALWSAPAILLILFAFDIWWKKKLSKCEDAHLLVDTYDKYTKANKILGSIVAFALVLYICYDIYSDFGKVSIGMDFHELIQIINRRQEISVTVCHISHVIAVCRHLISDTVNSSCILRQVAFLIIHRLS